MESMSSLAADPFELPGSLQLPTRAPYKDNGPDGESDYTIYSDNESSDGVLSPLTSPSRESVATVIDRRDAVAEDAADRPQSAACAAEHTMGQTMPAAAATLVDLCDSSASGGDMQHARGPSRRAPPRPPPPSSATAAAGSKRASPHVAPDVSRLDTTSDPSLSSKAAATVTADSKRPFMRAARNTGGVMHTALPRARAAAVLRGRANRDPKGKDSAAAAASTKVAGIGSEQSRQMQTASRRQHQARGSREPKVSSGAKKKKDLTRYDGRQALLDDDGSSESSQPAAVADPATIKKKAPALRAQVPGHQTVHLQSITRPRSKKPSTVLTPSDYTSRNNPESEEEDEEESGDGSSGDNCERLEPNLPAVKLRVQSNTRLRSAARPVTTKLFTPNQNKKTVVAAAFENYKQQATDQQVRGKIVKALPTEFISHPVCQPSMSGDRRACKLATEDDFDIQQSQGASCAAQGAGSVAFAPLAESDASAGSYIRMKHSVSAASQSGLGHNEGSGDEDDADEDYDDEVDADEDYDDEVDGDGTAGADGGRVFVRGEDEQHSSNGSKESDGSSSDVSRGSDSAAESSDGEERPEEVKPASAQWLDFQLLTSRITDTVQRTQASLKKLAAAGSAPAGGVGGGTDTSASVGRGTQAGTAWQSCVPAAAGQQRLPEQSGYVAMEFDDDYDPLKRTDVVGLAFGEKPFTKVKATALSASVHPSGGDTFDDQYEPDVDSADVLASAFGDGFRAKKVALPADVGFESSFAPGGGSSGGGRVASADASAATPQKAVTKAPPARPKAPPAAAAATKPAAKEAATSVNGSSSHSTPGASGSTRPASIAAAAPSQATALIDDLLGLSLTGERDLLPATSTVTSSGGCAEGAAGRAQPRGSGRTPDSAQQASPQSTVQINIIEASIEEACVDAESPPPGDDSSGSEERESSAAGMHWPSEDESSFEMVDGRAAGVMTSDGNAALDEFDAIVHRLSGSLDLGAAFLDEAVPIDSASCSAWAEADVLGLASSSIEFKADFSDAAALGSNVEFPSLSPFDALVETSPVSDLPPSDVGRAFKSAAAAQLMTAAADDPFSPAVPRTSTKDIINVPVTSDEASVKRVFKFARTFSETVNEEDDGLDPKIIGLADSSSSKDAEQSSSRFAGATAAASAAPAPQLQFVVDMTKPSPAMKRLPADVKKAANSLNIKPQAARARVAAVGQVVTKAVPRPKPQHPSPSALAVDPLSSSASPSTARVSRRVADGEAAQLPSGGRKIATQGEADLLSLQGQQKVVTLNFEIESPGAEASATGAAAVLLPLLPPPPPPTACVDHPKPPPHAAADSSSSDGETEDRGLAAPLVDLGACDTGTPSSTSGRGGSSPQPRESSAGRKSGRAAGSAAARVTSDGLAAQVTEVDGAPPMAAAATATFVEQQQAAIAAPEDEQSRLPLLPLEEFRPRFTGHGWTLLLRKPPKKSLTKKRFWEEVYVRLARDDKTTKLAFYRSERAMVKGEPALSELKLCAGHQVAPAGGTLALQQHDQYGKCHSVKLLHVHYRERPGMRAADRVAEALPGFLKNYVRRAASLQPVATSGGGAGRSGGGSSGSGAAAAAAATALLEHVPQTTELAKFGATDALVMRTFVGELEDALMLLPGPERIGVNIQYDKEEMVADAWDEYEALVDCKGHIVRQKARVRLFGLAFVSGMPTLELGINDRRRKGKEVVGRHDIVPVRAENWVVVESPELHPLIKVKEYEETGSIRFQPLDACKFELMRFRYRPKANYELPLQLDARMVVDREKRLAEIRADVMIPGYYSNSKRKGQVPCEDIQIAFPIPEEWIYKFRVEKHFKYGSLHAAARRPGKIKGIERLTSAMGSVVNSYVSSSFIECSVGDAKYEHVFHSVVWRIDCLPLRNQGAYKTHYFALRLELGPHDVIPDAFQLNAAVEFTMPHTTVSGTAIRSIANCSSSEPLEKWVYHHARFNYTVEMSFEREIKDLLPKDAQPQQDEEAEPEAAAAADAAERPTDDARFGDSSESSSDDDSTQQRASARRLSGSTEQLQASQPAAQPTKIEQEAAVDRLLDL